MWFTISLNCDIIGPSETGPRWVNCKIQFGVDKINNKLDVRMELGNIIGVACKIRQEYPGGFLSYSE